MADLSPKQKAWCDYYIESLNAKDAAIKAGYSEKTARQMGSENLSKPYLKKYIAERMAEKEAARIASQDEILAYLTSIMRGEMQEQVLRGIGMGEQTVARMDVSAKDRIKAAELIGKRYGIWTEKFDIKGALSVTILDDVEDEEE